MVIIISEFGIKIKNISAGTLYDVNLGTRDYFSYTEAMLNNSLFSAFLIKNGLNVYKGESTRDMFKGVIDTATAFLNIVTQILDKLPLLSTAIGGLAGFKLSKAGLGKQLNIKLVSI